MIDESIKSGLSADVLNQYYTQPRDRFIQTFPDEAVRSPFNPDFKVNFPTILAENLNRTNEVLSKSKNGNALVIASSGANFLLALQNEAINVDAIDNDPNQIAYNFAQAAFIVMTPKEKLLDSLSGFKKTSFNLGNFKNMALPDIRQRYLKDLGNILDKLEVPEQYREAIYQYFNYDSFSFDFDFHQNKNGKTLWEQFLDNYDQIRKRLSTKKGWNIEKAELTEWLDEHPNQYDAIYTSNVFGFIQDRITLAGFLKTLSGSLHQYGVANVFDTNRIDQPESQTLAELNLQTIDYSSYRNAENNNWLIVQKI